MLALCALADDPTDDPEEIQRRIAARNDGESLGFKQLVYERFVRWQRSDIYFILLSQSSGCAPFVI